MARARNIKPGFYKNEYLAECEPLARVLFTGLWTIADREGRLQDRPKRIKAELLPYDNCDIESLLNQLAERRFIIRYVVNEQRYICIPTFKLHQNPHPNEAKSIIPPAPEEIMKLHEDSITNNAESLFSESLISDSLLVEENKEETQDKTPPPDITQNEILILNELKKVKGYKFNYAVELAFIRKLAIDYPYLNALDQIRAWCARKLDDPLKNKSKPHGQLANWFMKAEQWRKEREDRNRGQPSQNNSNPSNSQGNQYSQYDSVFGA